MAPHYMPIYGEEGAPIFDQKHHSSLRQYFRQLETLFVRCSVTSDPEKKLYATQFPDADVAETWEALPEYSDATKTYFDLKKQLFRIYHQEGFRFTIRDLEQLVSDAMLCGIRTLQDLTEFHLRFNSVSSHLLDFSLLSERERSAFYLQAFATTFRAKIELRLQIQFPDYSPLFPQPIGSIFEAAQWVLKEPTAPQVSPTPRAVSAPSSTISVPSSVSQPSSSAFALTTTPASNTTSISTSEPQSWLQNRVVAIEDELRMLRTEVELEDEFDRELANLRCASPPESCPAPQTTSFEYTRPPGLCLTTPTPIPLISTDAYAISSSTIPVNSVSTETASISMFVTHDVEGPSISTITSTTTDSTDEISTARPSKLRNPTLTTSTATFAITTTTITTSTATPVTSSTTTATIATVTDTSSTATTATSATTATATYPSPYPTTATISTPISTLVTDTTTTSPSMTSISTSQPAQPRYISKTRFLMVAGP